VVEVPQQNKRLRAQSLLALEEEGFVSRLPLIRRPVVDTHDQVPFVASVSDEAHEAYETHRLSIHIQEKKDIYSGIYI